jgi:Fe-S-cluster containining protein
VFITWFNPEPGKGLWLMARLAERPGKERCGGIRITVALAVNLQEKNENVWTCRLAGTAASPDQGALDRFVADRTPAGCDALVRHLLGTIDARSAAARAAGAPIACAAGCTFCCHQRVSMFPFEALALYRYLRTQLSPAEAAAIEQQILENARRIDTLSADEHRRANIACAFLRAGRCSAYAVRPQACAAYHSMSRLHCEHAYEHPDDMGTPRNSRPVLLELQLHSAALLDTTRTAIEAAGFPAARGELHQLLRALIEAGRDDAGLGTSS